MTIQEIAQAAFNAAIDQQGDYESLTAAFEAYESNAEDTAAEYGLDAVECGLQLREIARIAGHGEAIEAMWTI